MNGVHDLGGTHGFGRVVREEDEPVFHAAWEGRAFGLSQFSVAAGIRACLDEVRYDMEQLDPVTYLRASYYERWLLGVERGLIRRGVLSAQEIAERRAELAADPERPLPSRRDDAFAEQLVRGWVAGRKLDRPVDRDPRFAVGDAVCTRRESPREHTRLARYARGRRGTVERVFCAFSRPEGAAVGVHEPDYVYAVRFAARELWGETAEPNATVCIDLFESYLVGV